MFLRLSLSLSLLLFTYLFTSGQDDQLIRSLPEGSKIVVAGKKYDRGGLHNFFWGKHYRKEWGIPVKVRTINLDTIYGGLTPIKKGGGRQTQTLRLEDKEGRQYVLRSIDKTFGGALPDIFHGTFVEQIANDQVSVAHPYSALTIPSLAEQAGVYHTNPVIVFLPTTKSLGEYDKDFANKLYLFEERPDGDWSKAPFFGKSEKIVGTENILEKVLEDNDNIVDQEAYVRARLFDMFIGDWGRHEDQWRWAKFDVEKLNVYRPIPRDRDQTYTLFDGLLVGMGAGSPQVGFLQSFDYTIKDLKKYNYQARHLDRRFANEPSLDTWIKIAGDLKDKLADTAIEHAILKLPPEVYPVSGPTLIAKLKSRRDKLVEYAKDYYAFLAKEVDIPGSKKNELFEINGATPAETLVNIFRLTEKGEKKELLYTRIFKAEETSEIRLYGIGGNDRFVVYGNPGKDIRIRLIGSAQKDSFIDKSSGPAQKNILLYDNAENHFSKDNHFKYKLSSDSFIHRYEYDGYTYSRSGITKGISYSNEDEIFLSLGYSIMNHKWRKDPFASKHSIKVNYSLTQKSFSAQYSSVFTGLIGKADLVLAADWDDVRSYHYPGVGNNTIISNADKNFYRTRFREYRGAVGLQRKYGQYFKTGINVFYEGFQVYKDGNKFISSSTDPSIFNTKEFAGAEWSYNIENIKGKVIVEKGGKLEGRVSYTENLKDKARHFLKYSQMAGYIFSLAKGLTLGIKASAQWLDGDAEFYQLPSLGGGNTLRGFLRRRFFGKTAFSNQNELQWNFKFRSYLFNGTLGLLAIFDQGRVWQPGETSDLWHRAAGGGLMIAPFDMFSITGSYCRSNEAGRFNIRLGHLLK